MKKNKNHEFMNKDKHKDNMEVNWEWEISKNRF